MVMCCLDVMPERWVGVLHAGQPLPCILSDSFLRGAMLRKVT